MRHNRGIAPIVVILIILLAGGGTYAVTKTGLAKKSKFTTKEGTEYKLEAKREVVGECAYHTLALRKGSETTAIEIIDPEIEAKKFVGDREGFYTSVKNGHWVDGVVQFEQSIYRCVEENELIPPLTRRYNPKTGEYSSVHD